MSHEEDTQSVKEQDDVNEKGREVNWKAMLDAVFKEACALMIPPDLFMVCFISTYSILY